MTRGLKPATIFLSSVSTIWARESIRSKSERRSMASTGQVRRRRSVLKSCHRGIFVGGPWLLFGLMAAIVLFVAYRLRVRVLLQLGKTTHANCDGLTR